MVLHAIQEQIPAGVRRISNMASAAYGSRCNPKNNKN